MEIQEIKNIYRPGAIVWVNYWATYDLVISFDVAPASKIPYSRWSVTVITCDENGTPLPGAEERTHCTLPDINPHRPHIFPTNE